jgi:hypothetical protein
MEPVAGDPDRLAGVQLWGGLGGSLLDGRKRVSAEMCLGSIFIYDGAGVAAAVVQGGAL